MASKTLQVKGLTKVQRKFDRFERLIKTGSKPAFDRAGKEAVDIITTRTLSGKDFSYKKFTKYSDSYADATGKTKVDLFRSGKMLKAIDFKAFAKGVVIFVKKEAHTGKINTYNLAIIHNNGAKAGRKHQAIIPKREFMALSGGSRRKILNIVREFYNKELRKVFSI